MGGLIIENSPEIQKILDSHSIAPEDLTSVFLKEKPGSLTAILSSDLDCDRLDYLMRTAHHAGLPYGNVDLDYIVNNITLDETGSVCLKKRALKAADHLLLSRYYDYTQLPYHKTVAALELSFEAVVKEFFETGRLDYTKEAMIDCVKKEEWRNIDDQYLIGKMRDALKDEGLKGTSLEMHIKTVLERKPPKLVFSTESIVSEETLEAEMLKKGILESKIKELSEKFEIPETSWHIWSPKPLSLTKFGSQIPITEATGFQAQENSQLVLIKGMDKNKPETSTPLVSCKNTLVNQLEGKKYLGIRLYVNIPDEKMSQRDDIESYILEEIKIIQN